MNLRVIPALLLLASAAPAHSHAIESSLERLSNLTDQLVLDSRFGNRWTRFRYRRGFLDHPPGLWHYVWTSDLGSTYRPPSERPDRISGPGESYSASADACSVRCRLGV